MRRRRVTALMLATAASALNLPGRRLRQRLRAATLDPTPENTWDATDETYDPRDSAINLALLDEPLELPETPSRPKILAFAAPVAVLNLANFIMGSVDTAAVSTDPIIKFARFRTATGAAKARIFGLEGVSGSSRGSSNNARLMALSLGS